MQVDPTLGTCDYHPKPHVRDAPCFWRFCKNWTPQGAGEIVIVPPTAHQAQMTLAIRCAAAESRYAAAESELVALRSELYHAEWDRDGYKKWAEEFDRRYRNALSEVDRWMEQAHVNHFRRLPSSGLEPSDPDCHFCAKEES